MARIYCKLQKKEAELVHLSDPFLMPICVRKKISAIIPGKYIVYCPNHPTS